MKGSVRYYQCNRGGVYKPKGTGQRQLKSQGTINAIIKYEKLLLPLVPQPSICIKQGCREGEVQQVCLHPQEWWKSARLETKKK